MRSLGYQSPTKDIGSETLRAQARAHVRQISRAYEAFYPDVERDEEGMSLTVLELFLAIHPMQAATRGQVAIHEAGHFVAFERLGLLAGDAEIRGSAGGRNGWRGRATSWDWRSYRRPEDWDAPSLRREAVAVLAGPMAEELSGGGDALSGIGELVEASVLAFRAAASDDRAPSEVLREVLIETISLVERHAPEIRGIGEVLARKKRIFCGDRPIREILARVPRGPIDIRPLSGRGQAIFGKVMGAFEHLGFLIQGVATDEQLGELA